MEKKMMTRAWVSHREEILDDVTELTLFAPDLVREARPGQFVDLYPTDGSKLLPRPISICRLLPDEGKLVLVFRVTGPDTGTAQFAELLKDMEVRLIGPLGKGFPMEEARGKRVLLIGGGIGIPPLLETACQLDMRPAAVLGYRNEKTFLREAFEEVSDVTLATEDGSLGTKGTVLDAIRAQKLTGDLIFACGPRPMLKAVKDYALGEGIPCWISMEERMACGIGACLGCVCGSAELDPHSNVKNKRVCTDGPVFRSTEVLL